MKFKSIFLFFLFSFSFLLLVNCSDTTSTQKGSLSGIINLENSQDNSGVSIAVYELAYLDTTIVRINNEYPHIGVKISQHTEFDHRLQTPIKTGTTAADGSFELEKIPTGTYNFVASKAGYGFRYIYEISISEGDNEISSMYNEQCKMKKPVISTGMEKSHSNRGILSSNSADNPIQNPNPVKYASPSTQLNKKINSTRQTGQECKMKKPVISTGMEKSHSYKEILSKNSACIPINWGKLRIQNSTFIRSSGLTLFPELHLSGDISEEVIVAPYHHLVCDDDVTFIPGSRLEIQPNAVVRIAGGKSIDIYGTVKLQGEEDGMFWVTTNDVFLTEEVEDINHYQTLVINTNSQIQNDKICHGKISYGNNSFIAKSPGLLAENMLFTNNNSGINLIESNNSSVQNGLFKNNTSASGGGIVFDSSDSFTVEKNIIINNHNGIYAKFCDDILEENNYITHNSLGIWHLTVKGEITHNELTSNSSCDIKVAANSGSGLIDITYNNLRSNTSVRQYEQGSFSSFHRININYNNFYSNYRFITYDSSGLYHGVDIDATENFFSGITESTEIEEMIIDTNSQNPVMVEVIFEPFQTTPNPNAGIQ